MKVFYVLAAVLLQESSQVHHTEKSEAISLLYSGIHSTVFPDDHKGASVVENDLHECLRSPKQGYNRFHHHFRHLHFELSDINFILSETTRITDELQRCRKKKVHEFEE